MRPAGATAPGRAVQSLSLGASNRKDARGMGRSCRVGPGRNHCDSSRRCARTALHTGVPGCPPPCPGCGRRTLAVMEEGSPTSPGQVRCPITGLSRRLGPVRWGGAECRCDECRSAHGRAAIVRGRSQAAMAETGERPRSGNMLFPNSSPGGGKSLTIFPGSATAGGRRFKWVCASLARPATAKQDPGAADFALA
jgi:hypothetical protein